MKNRESLYDNEVNPESLSREELIERFKQLRAENGALLKENNRWEPLRRGFVANEKKLEDRIRELEWRMEQRRQALRAAQLEKAPEHIIRQKRDYVRGIASDLGLSKEDAEHLFDHADTESLYLIWNKTTDFILKQCGYERAHEVIEKKIQDRDRKQKSLREKNDRLKKIIELRQKADEF
jgi:hypothetical protein